MRKAGPLRPTWVLRVSASGVAEKFGDPARWTEPVRNVFEAKRRCDDDIQLCASRCWCVPPDAVYYFEGPELQDVVAGLRGHWRWDALGVSVAEWQVAVSA